MKKEEIIPYLKTIMSVALADEKIEDSEFVYFNQIANMYGLSEDDMDDIQCCIFNKKEPIKNFIFGITERDTKLNLLYELSALCYVDNNFSSVEKKSIINVCQLLNIESEKLEEIFSIVEENYILQKKIAKVLER